MTAIARRPYDAGPDARQPHGTLEHKARPDPDRPMRDRDGTQIGYHQVQGARVRAGHDYLFARGTITADQYNTADRYVGTVERLHGARDRTDGAGRVPPHQQGHPSEGQVNAATDLRRAAMGVGKLGMAVINSVLLDGVTLTALAALYREPDKKVLGRLAAALDRLKEVWDGE